MTSSTFDQGKALLAWTARVAHRCQEVLSAQSADAGAGGLHATARDMARFISFHLAGGLAKGRRLVAPEVLKQMYVPQFTLPGQKAGYGLGVSCRPYHGATLAFHGGGGYGFSTDQRWVPEYGVGVVVLSNGEGGDNFVANLADRSLQAMIRAKRGALPQDEPLPWTREPLVNLEADKIRRLEGSYLVGAQVTSFRVDGNRLQLCVEARPAAGCAFAHAIRPRRDLYEFILNEQGRVREVHNHGDNGVSFLVPNDSPADAAGPGKAEWTRYLGRYQAKAYGQDDERTISLKRGYLYWDNRLKLTEYQPGLFFTADGDSVQFREGTVEYGNRLFRRSP